MKKRMWLGLAVAIAFILALVVAFPAQAQQGFTDFWNAVVMHTTLEVQGAATFTGGTTTTGAGTFTTYVQGADLKATDDLDVTDDARITGTVTAGNVSATTSVAAADLVASDDLDVTDDARITGTVTAGDVSATTTVAAADLTASDDLTVSDDMTVTGYLGRGIQVQAIVAGAEGAAVTYTPTQSIYELTAVAAATITLGLVANGQIVHITNDSNVTLLFPDSGNQLLGGARSVTQYDTLTVMQIAGKWREISFIAN